MKNYPFSGVQFVLTQPAVFYVTVKGEVSKTTEVRAWGLSRLSTVLSNVLTPYSSTRTIQVTSADGKTAVLTLDAFGTDDYIYNEDKTVKSDAELAENDQYFKLLNNLREIDKKTGVSNVVIDMSVNSGGNSLTMLRIMNLISATNKAELTFHDSATNVMVSLGSTIDSNNDGKYDDNDVYGKKYKFFILTSPVAFSCGTAMPFYVSHQHIGDIVGQIQGGGECALSQFVLPNGQLMAMSSSLHVAVMEEDGLLGDEAGVSPDISLSYFDFYNLEKLNVKIKQYREFVGEKDSK
jgi:C-terminal processing protease CtpA/Prc